MEERHLRSSADDEDNAKQFCDAREKYSLLDALALICIARSHAFFRF